MGKHPVLKRETAEHWFSSLGQKLGERYRVTYTDTRNGGFHLCTIYFKNTDFHLALYVVEYSGEYVVALCKMSDAKRRLCRAWSVADTRHIPASESKQFCGRCLYVHADVKDKCTPAETTRLKWNDPEHDSEEALFTSLSRRIMDGVDRELDDLLTIC